MPFQVSANLAGTKNGSSYSIKIYQCLHYGASSTFPLAIDCRQDKGKVIDYSNSVREFFSDETFEAIPAIHKNNKIPDTESLALLLAL